jgi:hypothetical protein
MDKTGYRKVDEWVGGIGFDTASVALKIIAVCDASGVTFGVAIESHNEGGNPHDNKEQKTHDVSAASLHMLGAGICAQMSAALSTFLHSACDPKCAIPNNFSIAIARSSKTSHAAPRHNLRALALHKADMNGIDCDDDAT